MNYYYYYYIDFEFRPHANRNDLVCCCILDSDGGKHGFDLTNEEGRSRLYAYIVRLQTPIFVAFAAAAEIGCFLDLGLMPRDFGWVCLHVLARPFIFGSSTYARFLDSYDGQSKGGLVACLEFFCGLKRDGEEKHDMIDLILSKTSYDRQEMQQIVNYCFEDVRDLPQLLAAIQAKSPAVITDVGDTLCDWVDIQRNGIPLNKALLDKAVSKSNDIRRGVIEELNQQFIDAGEEPFFVNVKGKYVEKYDIVKNYIDAQNLSDIWPKTDAGKYKIGRDDTRQFQHIDLVKKWRTTKQLISDLRMITEKRTTQRTKSDKKEFWDYISEDGDGYRQHPYYNAYGSVTGRFQAPATSFIYAQPSWMRVFIDPPKGHCILSVDFVSQEIWIAAALSNDLNMIDDYETGDPYLAFGKNVGYLPASADKKSHEKERNICKGVLLGLQFGMGANKLAAQLNTQVIEAQELINMHKNRYHQFWNYRREFIALHEIKRYSTIKNGSWYISDNRSAKTTDHYREGDHFALTTSNFAVQGAGAEILRQTVNYLIEGHLIISTVHDEINFLCADDDVGYTVRQVQDAVKSACSKINKTFKPCRIDYEIQQHGQLCIKSKGRPALERLKQYLEIEI